MLADVTNRAKGARIFSLAGGRTCCLEPGVSARLDLADHPSHDAWTATGEVTVAFVADALHGRPGHGGESAAGRFRTATAAKPHRRGTPSRTDRSVTEGT